MSADLSVQEFHDRAAKFIRESFPPCAIEVTEQNSFRLKARITIRLAVFIDVFYSARTRRTSIAVIREGKRAFGVDNLGGWHVHPVGENHVHLAIEEPAPEDLFRRCLEAIKMLEIE